MPNLIHSLDGSSLSSLYYEFSQSYNNPQFFSVHDCFATTCDKVETLKTLLASVYTDMYSSKPYLLKFDENILNTLEVMSDAELIREERKVIMPDGKSSYLLHDID
jgi:DNA-directed RNA polymerase